MKLLINRLNLIIIAVLLTAHVSVAQNATSDNSKTKNETTMKTYVIERDIPGAGKFTGDQLKATSITSCGVLKEMGPKIEWIHSYVAGDKVYCIYRAQNEALIREHGRKSGIPVTKITELSTTISPATANQ